LILVTVGFLASSSKAREPHPRLGRKAVPINGTRRLLTEL
jgi:hypothetical protein